MITAIIFDCFGVLATDGWLPFRAKYFGDNPELDAQARAYNKLVDAGKMSYAEFIPTVAALAKIPDQEAFAQIEHNVPNEPLFDYIQSAIQPHYKLGMLSNAGDNWLADIFTPEQVKLFDAIALSYETGVIKPHPSAYTTIAERLNTPPNQCLFIDDQPAYCEGARQVGMAAIQYQSLEQLQTELAAQLHIS